MAPRSMTAVPRPDLSSRLVAELPALRAWLRRAAGADGEDLAQEAIARALKYGGSHDGERELGPWLRGIALRLLADHRARRARAPQALEGDAHAEPSRPQEFDEREALERRLAGLSEIERDVLRRFHARAESVREIAKSLGVPEGTVKSHLHRARQKLAQGTRPS